MPWSVRITHCYSVTSCCGHPRHVKARAQAQPGVPNLFFHRRAPLQMAHERYASVVAGTNATLVRLPTPSHSCILAFGPWEPLTEAICKELCSETSSGSPLLVLVLGHSHTTQHRPLASSQDIQVGGTFLLGTLPVLSLSRRQTTT